MLKAKVAIIGGTGFYMLDEMIDIEEVEIITPFGKPSDSIRLGTFNGIRVAFLPRHGRGHRLNPSEVPSRANLYALKSLGVEFIFSICAVGSLKENIKPGDIVIPDQIIDRTKNRPFTFFEKGIVCHIPFANPFCSTLREILYDCSIKIGARVHDGGTCIVMEGPQFSTRAESELYRSWGADTIVMTLLPEAKLAREAEICYANLSVVTDYDCWYERHEPVSVELIINNLNRMVETTQKIIKLAIKNLPDSRNCECASALKNSITTDLKLIPDKIKSDLNIIIGKYLGE